MDFAGMELQEGGFYRVRDSEDPGWEPIARFDSVKADRAYFGDPRDEDCWFFVSKHAVALGSSTIEAVVLQGALTIDATYDVASKRWEGKRRLTYRGPGPTTASSWNGVEVHRSPSLRFMDEAGHALHVGVHTVWVAFLT